MFIAGVIASIVNYHLSPYSANFWIANAAVTGGYAGTAFVLRRLMRTEVPFRHLSDVFRYSSVAIGGACCVASIGAVTLVWTKSITQAEYPRAALNWLVGDSVADSRDPEVEPGERNFSHIQGEHTRTFLSRNSRTIATPAPLNRRRKPAAFCWHCSLCLARILH
jgi:hypothetical protein